MAPKQKTKKKTFNDNERAVSISEVEARKRHNNHHLYKDRSGD